MAAIVFVQLAILTIWPVLDGAIFSQARPRVAIVGFNFSRENGRPIQLESALVEALRRDQRVSLLDETLVRPAVTGIGYTGSINMSKDEARKLGAAIGCDFFIVGKTEALSRSEHENETHEEAYAAVMIVDGRSGALQVFDFISGKAETRENALTSVVKNLNERTRSYIDQIVHAGESPSAGRSETSPNTEQKNRELIEDMPAEGSRRSVGFTPPEFLNRVRPEYPPQADLADIAATVEAMVVLRSDGQVGSIEIARWAGFGLEDSSERAIRQLKFKPATRDGRPINVRALIQYNFRRSNK
ncbi:MAG TPA: energy transducer TonB [Blastocatellia bacterium]|nr:energy transducer TonB [Blastocatellia bacterium]